MIKNIWKQKNNKKFKSLFAKNVSRNFYVLSEKDIITAKLGKTVGRSNFT
jgi:hypothetical protein